MATTDRIEANVRTALADTLAVDESLLRSEASLREDLGADSLAIAEALVQMERSLAVELPDSGEFIANLNTVGDVVAALVSARL